MAKRKSGLARELDVVLKTIEAEKKKAQGIFLKFLKENQLEDLRFLSSEEYDDNNYYTYIRPKYLGRAEFDIFDLEQVDKEDFDYFVREIIRKDLMDEDRDTIEEALNLKLGESDLIELMQEIARRGLDPKKTITAICECYAQFPQDFVPQSLIEN